MSRELIPSRLPVLGSWLVPLDDPFRFMEREFQEFLRRPLDRSEELARRGVDRILAPRMNTRQTAENFIFEIALPGYQKENITINQTGRQLAISGGVEEEENAYSSREFWQSRFSRSFSLPETANPATITVHFRAGVLTLEVAKIVPGLPGESQQLAIED